MRIVLVGLLVTAVTLEAQDAERPVPFDSAGRVLTITPRFAARFVLTGPTWPVTGDFVEARLYQRAAGDFVLVVQRPGGVLERTTLTESERTALLLAVSASLIASGGVTTIGERADIISEPAGGAFTRNQTVAAALIWGPSLAAITDDASIGTAAYLGVVGTTFFVTSAMARSGTITRAQNHMATDGARRGAFVGSALSYVVGGDDASGRATAASILGASLVTAGLGYNWARLLTDGEAHGATWGSTYLAALSAGVIEAAGGWDRSDTRGAVAAVVGVGLVGYPLGLQWVRRSRYGITAGDIRTVATSAIVGVVAAGTLLSDSVSNLLAGGALTTGLVAGSVVGARLLARPFDFTESQGLQLSLGALAGGLMGIVVPVLAEADDARVYAGLGALGAAGGMAITKGILSPERARRDPPRGTPPSNGKETARVRFMPGNLAGLLVGRSLSQTNRRPSPVPLLSVRF